MRTRCFVHSFLCVLVLLQYTFVVPQDACLTEKNGLDSCEEVNSASTWVDEVGDMFQQFLQQKVFGREDIQEDSGSVFLPLLLQDHGNHGPSEPSTKPSGEENPFLGFISRFMNPNEKQVDDSNPFRILMDRLAESDGYKADSKSEKVPTSLPNQTSVLTLLDRVKHLDDDDHALVGPDFFRIIHDTAVKAIEQLQRTFGDILLDIDPSVAISLIYYLTNEDAIRTPSWKRRQHRFYQSVSKPLVVEMHDALYLSQLSYVNSMDDFKKGLKEFQKNEWQLAYGTTDSLPHLPAHFMLIHKNLSPLSDQAIQSIFPWQRRHDTELTALLLVRGTKELSDALADALLQPVEYRGGFAHGGILENGKNLAKKYIPKLKALLKHSGRDKIKLYLVGHSLGAGAAAIAAMEFNDYDWIKVESIGFGCPSLISHELSEQVKGYVTTVISDSDVIPRMSGASIVNLFLNLIEFDWTDLALDDIAFTMERADSTFPFTSLLPPKEKVLEWAKSYLEREFKWRYKKEKRERVSNLLIPPGDCIHFFRDGVGYSAVYTPCSTFDNIEVSRTLVDDHLIMPGYHRALISIVRDWENDFNFDFPHDISSIPV